MRLRTTLVLVLGVLVLAGSASAQEEGSLFQYRFKKGQVLRYQLSMKSQATFTMPDGAVETQNMRNFMQLAQEMVDENEDGSYRLLVTVEKASQTVDGVERTIPVQPEHAQLITMKKNGKIVESGEGPPPAQQVQMVFPEKPIKPGESWKQLSRIDQPIPLTTTTEYTLERLDAPFPGYDGPTALIQSTMAIENEQTITGEHVSSSTRGNLWFDVRRGRIVRSRAASNFKFDLPINIPGVVSSSVKVNLTLDVEITLLGASTQ